MEFSDFPVSFWSSVGLKPIVFNNRSPKLPNLWCLGAVSISHQIIFVSSQYCAFSVVYDNQILYFAAVYASTLYKNRKDLWKELADLEHSYPGPWLFIGGF